MSKKIAVINDLSGFGRCSLTAAISVIAAMGVQPCSLPTAILTAQTGFPSYYCDDYTDKMQYFQREWMKMNAEFDGIYSGFVASDLQIKNIFKFLDKFYQKKTFFLADPVMGDNGNVFAMFSNELCTLMKELVKRADAITPNVTELCLLTGTDYRLIKELTKENEIIRMFEQLAKELMIKGPKTIVVTGVHVISQSDGMKKIGNLAVTEDKTSFTAFPYMGGSYSGTGDLFASVIAGGLARGDNIESCVELAGAFIEKAILDSVKENIPYNEGVNYEQHLRMLL